MVIGALEVDLAAQSVRIGGEDIVLRPKERELLLALVERAGETVSRERLLRDVWGYSQDVDSRTIDWHVAALRRKLSEHCASDLIRTVRKVGYQLVLEGAGTRGRRDA